VRDKKKPASERETLRAIFEARGDAALVDWRFWQRVKRAARLARTPVEYSAPIEWDTARLAAEMKKDRHLFDNEKDPDRRRESDAARRELRELFKAMTSRRGVRAPRNMVAAVAVMRVLKDTGSPRGEIEKPYTAATLARYVRKARPTKSGRGRPRKKDSA
jgi:hypothetical protein